MIINLTQHTATPQQIAAGVVEPVGEDKEYIQSLLTFETLEQTSVSELVYRANRLAVYAEERGYSHVMIGGAPFFMSVLEKELLYFEIKPVYAFSVRRSVEKDGVKTSVFEHAGFVEVTQ